LMGKNLGFLHVGVISSVSSNDNSVAIVKPHALE
jgi:hypothetical protein